jgi:type IV secretory pathway component VirB8
MEDTNTKLAALEAKIDKIYISVEKARKYMLWSMIITIIIIVLPAIGLVFAIPSFLNNYVGSINTLTQ